MNSVFTAIDNCRHVPQYVARPLEAGFSVGYAGGMTHAYFQLIQAWHSQPDDDNSPPSAYIWRDQRYEVLDAWAEWHLMDRWWEPPVIPGVREGFSDRIYHRLGAQVQGHRYDIICEVYWDRSAKAWVMARIYD